MELEVVWLNERRCFAFLVRRDAFFSTVRIPEVGVETVSNDDYEFWRERSIEHESD